MEKNDASADLGLQMAVAVVLLTRLPLPPLPGRAFAHQAQAAWAFPLAGLLVGALAGGVGAMALAAGLPAAVAAGLILAAQIVLTGAMHEDGLGDSADGLWGGFDRERRLAIMKDSAIGTYGVLALVMTLGLRWIALAALLALGTGAVAVVAAVAALSRAPLGTLMTALPPARRDGLSRGVGRPGAARSTVALMLGTGIALALLGPVVLAPAAVALAGVALLGLLARARIGGQTGDILGAAQQIGEVLLLLGLLLSLAS